MLSVSPAGRRLYERIRKDLVAEAQQLLEDFEPEVRKGAARLILRLARAAAVRSGVAPGVGLLSSLGLRVGNDGRLRGRAGPGSC